MPFAGTVVETLYGPDCMPKSIVVPFAGTVVETKTDLFSPSVASVVPFAGTVVETLEIKNRKRLEKSCPSRAR